MPSQPTMRLLFAAAVATMAIVVFLSNFAVVLLSTGYLNSLAHSTSTWQNSGADIGSQDVADSIVADVTSYVTGKSAAMAHSSYFREEELLHLYDVRHKMAVFHLLFYSLVAAMAVIFLIMFIAIKNINKFVAVAKSIFFASGVAATAISLLLFLLSLNFGASFTAFHKLLFAGSQWQFPSNYLMVNLFTADFFAGIAMAVVAAAFVEGFALMVTSFIIGKFYNPKAVSVKA